jgi:hypothetical protein
VRGATLLQRSGQGGIDAPAAARDDDGHYLPPGGSVSMLLELLGGPEGTLFGRPARGFAITADRLPTRASASSRSRRSAGASSPGSRS